MTASSHKLRSLLRLLWQNPLFGDSFPASLDENKLLRLFDDVYARLVELLPPVLQQGMPEASPEQVRQIFDEIAPKSVAFCAAISAGEIENADSLAYAAAAIALSYWADQSIDRGDEAMIEAVQVLNGQRQAIEPQPDNLVACRLEGLRQIRYYSEKVNNSSEDLPFIVGVIQQSIPLDDVFLHSMSNLFLQNPIDSFWEDHAQEIAKRLINCAGFMSAGSILYALYRRSSLELSSLAEIVSDSILQEFIYETCNPAVRVFDDVGDAWSDSGENASWAVFSLNVINQNHPLLVKHFLTLSGIPENYQEYIEGISLFALPLQQRRIQVVVFYRDLVRQRLQKLPRLLWDKYALFLTLSKRILEASFVNLVGDAFLAENGILNSTDKIFLESVRNQQLLPLERM